MFFKCYNAAGHELSVVNIMFEISLLRVRKTTQEHNSFMKDQCFGAMKIRNEWSQDTASLNPLLVFAAVCLISTACSYSVKWSKSLT